MAEAALISPLAKRARPAGSNPLTRLIPAKAISIPGWDRKRRANVQRRLLSRPVLFFLFIPSSES
jgi:hypothetical protein